MGRQHQHVKLTSAEISQLWATFLNDSASIPVITYFLHRVDDEKIKSILEYALSLSQEHVRRISAIITMEGYAVPHGFKLEEDVDLNAPRLFADTYYLNFVHHMSKIGLNGHSTSLSVAVRDDVTKFFRDCLVDAINLYERSKEILLSKGIYIRSPFLPMPDNVEYVKNQSFLKGFLGEKRPLTAIEVTNFYTNQQRNILGVATMIGFSQVASSKDVRQFLIRGRDIAKKHVNIFHGYLEKNFLPSPMTWSSDVTDSTTYVFSDKLMMFFTTILIGLGVQYYGQSLATSPRKDLGVMYNRLTAEIQLYAEDGANIMIKNKWLEQPPLAPDRDKLANEKSNN
ncbi:DUF3231 family protein [Niallia taxi]|nr:DUF3231 family protein [Niallia taxi]MDE5056017.1 DUF3231 family protein [Niallia taxi]